MKARGKDEQYRSYENAADHVKQTYADMQQQQTVQFVTNMKHTYAAEKGYRTPDGRKLRIPFEEIPAILDTIIDESDPDNDLPQLVHAFQTGEALRSYLQPDNASALRADILAKDLFTEEEWSQLPQIYQLKFNQPLRDLYPHITDWSWLPLVGFLHDSGKVLAVKEWGALPQWAVVGDTFPVGAPFAEANVYVQYGFFRQNPDLNMGAQDPKMWGKYQRHCGFGGVDMSWGHDEYLFSVLQRTRNVLPPEALYIIRYHSFYPWHSPRNGKRGYTQLANDEDWMRLPLLKAFQQSDLYSKKGVMPNQEELKEYYMGLLQRYLPRKDPAVPAKVRW